MSDKTVADYLIEAPKDWDFDYAKLWAKMQVSQDIKRNKNRQIEQLQNTNQELLLALGEVREFVAYVAQKSGLTHSDAESYLQQIELAITNANK